jgi:hypothetical protein
MKMIDKLGLAYDERSLTDGSPESALALSNAKALGMTSAPLVEVRDDSGALVRTLSGYRPAELREIAGVAH